MPEASEPAVESAAAAAIVRRPLPPGGLTLQVMRDYSEDEVDAELRALGIYTGNTRIHDKKIMIVNYYDNHKRGGRPLPKIKPPSRSLGSLKQPSDAMIHDLSILSGLPPENVRAIFGWTVKDLKLEVQSRGAYIRSNATKQELVKEVVKIFGSDFMSSKGSPMSVDSPYTKIIAYRERLN